MDTLKTAVVVVLLLAVVYGAYVVLNKSDGPLPQEIAWHEQKSAEPLQIDMGSAKSDSTATTGDTKAIDPNTMWSTPAPTGGAPKPYIHAELSPEEPAASDANALPPLPTGFGSASASEPAPVKPPADFPVAVGSSPPASAPSLLSVDAAPKSSDDATEPAAQPSNISELPTLPDLRSETKADVAVANVPSTSLTTESPGSAIQADNTPQPLAPEGVAENTPAKPDSGAFQIPGGTPSTASSEASPAAEPAERPMTTTAGVYDNSVREAYSHIESGKWLQALAVLSKFVHSPDLNSEQQQQLYDLLDPLAAKVVYSTEHLVEPAYEVGRGEKLADIAGKYSVPWELLANINGVENPDLLVPGTKLKVLKGPFRAEIHLRNNELTLFAGELYAGRFPISIGTDPAPKPGEYQVMEKQPGRVYYAGDGRTIAAEDPANPYGRVWIGLGGEMSIHASPESGENSTAGCISLSPLDASDVSSILSVGSPVVIHP